MKQEQKSVIIDAIAKDLAEYSHVYVTDISGFTVETVNQLRRLCFRRNIKLKVVKNTLLKRAMDQSEVDYSEIYPALAGTTSIMLSNTGNAPAKVIKEFRAKNKTINRPDKLIITREVTKAEAMLQFRILTGLGIACGLALAISLKSLLLGSIFVVVPGVLWFYSSSYKRMFLVGNLVIALLSGLTPLLVAFANAAALRLNYGPDHFGTLYVSNELMVWTGGFGLFAFLCTWIREIIKDMQDVEGDRELECHTLPVKSGDLVSKIVVTTLILLTCVLLSNFNFRLLPVPFSWGSFVSRFYLLLLVAFVCELSLLWVAKLPSDYRNAQLLMKFIMFMGTMYAICVPKILEAAALS